MSCPEYMSRSISETPLLPPTKVQVPAALDIGVTVLMNLMLSVLMPLPVMTAEVFLSPKVAPSTSLMSVDSPSHPPQTFEDVEDVSSLSPTLGTPLPFPLFPLSLLPPLPTAHAHSDSSSSSPSNLSSLHRSISQSYHLLRKSGMWR